MRSNVGESEAWTHLCIVLILDACCIILPLLLSFHQLLQVLSRVAHLHDLECCGS